MQLVAYGAQDVYLTGNPQITFFKVVYRRHTNFAVECIEHPFTGTADFGRKALVTVVRNGDLVTKMYLRARIGSVSAPNLSGATRDLVRFAWVRKLGHAIMQDVNVEIGGAEIDKQYGDWLNLWHELTSPVGQSRGYDKMIGDVSEMTELSSFVSDVSEPDLLKRAYTLFVPLQFWFNRNNGLALPLIALQYHEVRLNFTFRSFDECAVYSGPFNVRTMKTSFEDAALMVDYVYLDSEERRRFAQVGHEYLIEQVQFTGEESVQSTSSKFQLHFNHPTKELVFAMQLGNYSTGKQFMAYTNLDNWNLAARNEMAEKLLMGQILTNADGIVVTKESETGLTPVAPDSSVWVKLISPADDTKIAAMCSNIPLSTGEYIWVVKNSLVGSDVAPYVRLNFANATVDLRDYVTGHSNFVQTGATGIGRLTATVTENNLTLALLSQPVSKYLVDNRDHWIVAQDITVWQHHNYGLYIDGSANPVVSGKLQLNGHDRFDDREGQYFNYVQPWQHHSNTPADGINVYSFALKPEDHQPSGTCNMSRIDTAQLNLAYEDTTGKKAYDFRNDFLDDNTVMFIFAASYNVLRIMSGMGGLAYSN
jgi:hypothetical protein